MIFVYMGEICSSRNPEQLKHYVIFFFAVIFFLDVPSLALTRTFNLCRTILQKRLGEFMVLIVTLT